MVSRITELSAEILSRIFEHLSIRQKDIAACRLVNRIFLALSTEYHITRVVFANRLGTIQHLWKVLEHPYYRLHVRELVYDGSTFEEAPSTDFDEYLEEVSNVSSPQTEASRNGEDYMRLHYQVFQCSSSVSKASERWHTASRLRGFHEYSRQWMMQEWIIEDGLGKEVLRTVLAQLPKLRRIIFTDFRELAQPGESYDHLCDRLFQGTLQPRGLYFSDRVWEDFLGLLDLIAELSQTNITSLIVGEHPYESLTDYLAIPANDIAPNGDYSYPTAVPYDTDLTKHYEGMQLTTQKLQYLRLPIKFILDGAPGVAANIDTSIHNTFTGRMLQYSAPSLVQLSLCCVDLMLVHRANAPSVQPQVRRCLEFLLFATTFPLLQRLELQGWPMPEHDVIIRFLSKHSTTLKEICLLDCTFFEDPRILREWVGASISLYGVRLERSVRHA